MRRPPWLPLFLLLAVPLRGGDWPQWRADAQRSAATPHGLPASLHLQWVLEYPPLEPAWEDPVNRDRMPFDRVYEPIVLGSTMFVGSSRTDRVAALDTRTGEERWRFYADGPVRLPPVAWAGRVAFVSDDGHLYCLDAASGKLEWKVRGGPDERKVLGNGRLVSAWPARGGPVLADGTIYFAASIWPFMGTYVHAVDAATGKLLWTNDGSGAVWMNQPHGGSVAFGGVAPQGALAVAGDRLLVPCGRSVPACFDRHTGELLYYHLSGSPGHAGAAGTDRKLEGGSHVAATERFFLNHRGLATGLYDLATGGAYTQWKRTAFPVLADGVCFLSGKPIVAVDLAGATRHEKAVKSKDSKTGKEKVTRKVRWEVPTLWQCEADASQALIRAGGRLYAGGKGSVTALDLPDPRAEPAMAWTQPVEGTPARLLAADGRLFAVTLEGRIYAFGESAASPAPRRPAPAGRPASPGTSRLAKALIATTQARTGHCLVFGLHNPRLAEELVRHSELQVTAVGEDAAEVGRLRRRWDAEGIYGTRVTAHVGDPLSFGAPPYLAALTVIDALGTVGLERAVAWLPAIARSMRPYGGTACVVAEDPTLRDAFARRAEQAALAGVRVTRAGRFVWLVREGPLPGAAPWTHQYGDMANTAKSNDRRVRPPLGLLWFGGSSHHDVLPRHGHGPTEQVVGGRLFIQGLNLLSCRDVYTGQVLWKRHLPDLGTFGVYYDKSYVPNPLDTTYNQAHIPGANSRGTNFVAAADRVYLAVGAYCVALDAATGEPVGTLSLPDDGGRKPIWGYIGLADGLLIAGASFAAFPRDPKLKVTAATNFDVTSSRRLVVMDPATGKALWQRSARHAFRHNAICAGGGRLYCIDSVPDPVAKLMARRGKAAEIQPELLALDLRTGRVLWRTAENVFGTWLAWSAERDLLIQSGRLSRDMIAGEPSKRIIAHRAADGTVVWDKPIPHGGPLMLHGDTLYTNAASSMGEAVSLLTGDRVFRKHPLTGEPVPWRYYRTYGCNHVVASEHLLTFRSGAAAYYDLTADAGTASLGGFKSGCTSNLIVADGVLNAPDYTRTCTCSYQNQTSLALVHVPDAETWTFNQIPPNDGGYGRVRHVGINLGAPGDRKAANGTLWLDYPVVGGPSPPLAVKAEGKEPRYLRRHSSAVQGGPLPWVAASGVVGLERITVGLLLEDEKGMVPVIESGAQWHYLAGSPPPPDWTSTGFEPKGWKTGPAGFGYGDDDDATVLDDMEGKYKAIHIRRTFQVTDPEAARKLALKVRYDDAFVAYLNGHEVLRVGVAKGRGAAAGKVKGHEAKGFERFAIAAPAKLLRAGTNVLAIEGHNDDLGSSDFTLDPYLLRDQPPGGPQPRPYTVRLVFAEMEGRGPGERVFGVRLQDRTVEAKLDVAAAAGGPRRSLVREYRGILAGDTLTLELVPADTPTQAPPILSGIEIVAEGW